MSDQGEVGPLYPAWRWRVVDGKLQYTSAFAGAWITPTRDTLEEISNFHMIVFWTSLGWTP